MAVKDEQRRTSRELRRDSVCEDAAEPQAAVSADGEATKKGATTASRLTSVAFSVSRIASVCVRVCVHTYNKYWSSLDTIYFNVS